MDEEIDFVGSVVKGAEYHPKTGELLTLYVETKDGRFVRVVPVDYYLAYHETPYMRQFYAERDSKDSTGENSSGHTEVE